MKPKPMQPKTKRENDQPTMATLQPPTRMIYVRDPERTQTGFASHELASEAANAILKPDCLGTRDSSDMRVRVSYRSRTGLYDVVVKVAKRVPLEVGDRAIGE